MSPMHPSPKRLEWIWLVYLVFFVLAVLSPSLYRHDIFGITQETLEEMTIFLFGLAGILTFTFYERLMERREKERERAETDFRHAQQELIQSYAYIGSINRKIELLKKFADDTSRSAGTRGQLPKDVFLAIASHACASAGGSSALIRFVDADRLRTEREFVHHANGDHIFRVPNRDLKQLSDKSVTHGFVVSEDRRQVLVVPSDRPTSAFKSYLMVVFPGDTIPELDVSLLKVFVNQAEMLYHQLAIV